MVYNNMIIDGITEDAKMERKDVSYNLDKFGADRDHNTLYITGLSGSGKSSLADSYDDNTEVVHLDAYYELRINNVSRNDSVNDYLAKNFKQYDEFRNDFKSKKFGNVWDKKNPHHEEYFKIMDNFMIQLDKYSKLIYPKKKLIVEGIQLYDAMPSYEMFNGKPLIIKGTGSLQSFMRKAKRDDVKPIKFILNYSEVMSYYRQANSLIDKLRAYMDSHKK